MTVMCEKNGNLNRYLQIATGNAGHVHATDSSTTRGNHTLLLTSHGEPSVS